MQHGEISQEIAKGLKVLKPYDVLLVLGIVVVLGSVASMRFTSA